MHLFMVALSSSRCTRSVFHSNPSPEQSEERFHMNNILGKPTKKRQEAIAFIMILLSPASINTINLQPSRQGNRSGPAAEWKMLFASVVRNQLISFSWLVDKIVYTLGLFHVYAKFEQVQTQIWGMGLSKQWRLHEQSFFIHSGPASNLLLRH